MSKRLQPGGYAGDGLTRLYAGYFSMSLKSLMEHKVSFAFLTVTQLFMSFFGFLEIWFIYTRFNEVAGFSLAETLLCFASVNMSFALAEMFTRGFDVFSRMLGDGRFDRMLTRPRGIIFQIMASQIEFHRLGRFTQAAVVLAYAMPASGLNWTASRITVLCLMILCGAAVFFGLFLIQAGITFFTTRQMEFINVLTHGGRSFGRYPFSVYGDGVLKFLTFAVPLALFQYYPLMYLLGRETNLVFAVSPLASLLFLIPAYGMFRMGLKHYKSTGS